MNKIIDDLIKFFKIEYDSIKDVRTNMTSAVIGIIAVLTLFLSSFLFSALDNYFDFWTKLVWLANILLFLLLSLKLMYKKYSNLRIRPFSIDMKRCQEIIQLLLEIKMRSLMFDKRTKDIFGKFLNKIIIACNKRNRKSLKTDSKNLSKFLADTLLFLREITNRFPLQI